jgi:exonuclease V gamma subunit
LQAFAIAESTDDAIRRPVHFYLLHSLAIALLVGQIQPLRHYAVGATYGAELPLRSVRFMLAGESGKVEFGEKHFLAKSSSSRRRSLSLMPARSLPFRINRSKATNKAGVYPIPNLIG